MFLAAVPPAVTALAVAFILWQPPTFDLSDWSGWARAALIAYEILVVSVATELWDDVR